MHWTRLSVRVLTLNLLSQNVSFYLKSVLKVSEFFLNIVVGLFWLRIVQFLNQDISFCFYPQTNN